MKTFKFRELNKILRKNGWHEVGSKGNHRFYRSEHDKRKLVVPHSTPNQTTYKKLIKEYGINLAT